MRQVPDASAKLDIAERSWCWRAAKQYHNLPAGIKNAEINEFKAEFKAWVKIEDEP